MSTSTPPRLPAGERLRRAGVGAWSIIGLLILAAISIFLLLKVRVIFPPLGVALIIIYVLNPVVNGLQRRGVNRALGAIVAYVVAGGLVTLIILALIRPVSNQIETFGEQAPEFRHEAVTFVQDGAGAVERRFGLRLDTTEFVCLIGGEEDASGIGDDPTQSECDEVTESFRQQIADRAGRITEIGGTILEVLLVFVLGPLLALYLLIDLPNLQRDVLNLVPETHKAEAADLGSKVASTIGGFFRGQLLVAMIVGIFSSVGFALIGLPFWLVIGAIAGITNLIPLVGPFIGGTVGFVIGTISDDIGLGLKAALVALVVQQVDNHVISPNVMKRTVQLHPVTVMLSLLAGGTLAGFWGILLGVPMVAVAKLLIGHLWVTRVLGVEASPFARAVGTGRDAPSVVPETGPSSGPRRDDDPSSPASSSRPDETPDPAESR